MQPPWFPLRHYIRHWRRCTCRRVSACACPQGGPRRHGQRRRSRPEKKKEELSILLYLFLCLICKVVNYVSKSLKKPPYQWVISMYDKRVRLNIVKWQEKFSLICWLSLNQFVFENYYRIRHFLKVICITFWRGFEWEWDSDIDTDLSVVFLGLGSPTLHEVV